VCNACYSLQILTGYIYGQGGSESLIGILTGLGAIFGIIGCASFPYLKSKLGGNVTGNIGFGINVILLTLCVGSVFGPGSPFDPNAIFYPFSSPNSNPNSEHQGKTLEGLWLENLNVYYFILGIVLSRFGTIQNYEHEFKQSIIIIHTENHFLRVVGSRFKCDANNSRKCFRVGARSYKWGSEFVKQIGGLIQISTRRDYTLCRGIRVFDIHYLDGLGHLVSQFQKGCQFTGVKFYMSFGSPLSSWACFIIHVRVSKRWDQWRL